MSAKFHVFTNPFPNPSCMLADTGVGSCARHIILYRYMNLRQGKGKVSGSVGDVSVVVVVSDAVETGVVVTVVVALPPLIRVNRSERKLLPRLIMTPVAM